MLILTLCVIETLIPTKNVYRYQLMIPKPFSEGSSHNYKKNMSLSNKHIQRHTRLDGAFIKVF